MTSTNVYSPPPRTVELPHTLEEVRAERARRSLEAYVREAWKSVEPDTPFHSNWHIGAICYHLEAITAGDIRNLLINVPPGFMKSLLVSVFWPTWEWGPRRMPHLRYLTASNGRELAVRDTLRARRLILSPWYQRHYGDEFELLDDQNRKMRFDNDRAGARLATSVGSGTGERGNRVIFDDPHQLDDADHPEALAAAVEYNNVTLDSRLADRERDAKVVVQQRVATEDVTGDILRKMEEGGRRYEVLCLPMRHDPAHQLALSARNALPWRDPRQEAGELLDPGRYGLEAVEEDEITYGDRSPAILGQRPEQSATSIFDRQWWERPGTRFHLGGPRPAEVRERYLSLDTALKDKDASDYTACVVFEVLADYRIRVVDAWRAKLQFPALLSAIRQSAAKHDHDGKLRAVVIEDKVSGTSALQTLRLQADPHLARKLVAFSPQGSKNERARQAAVWCGLGLVALPEPGAESPWLFDLLEELLKVPMATPGGHRDQADAFAQGVIYLERYLAHRRKVVA